MSLLGLHTDWHQKIPFLSEIRSNCEVILGFMMRRRNGQLLAFVLLLIGFVAASRAASDPIPGLWFSPAMDGHGFDLQQTGDRWVLVFYSYDADGLPEWFLSVATESEGVIDGALD